MTAPLLCQVLIKASLARAEPAWLECILWRLSDRFGFRRGEVRKLNVFGTD